MARTIQLLRHDMYFPKLCVLVLKSGQLMPIRFENVIINSNNYYK